MGAYSITVSAVGFEPQTKYNLPITSGNSNEVSFDLLGAAAMLNNVTIPSTRAQPGLLRWKLRLEYSD